MDEIVIIGGALRREIDTSFKNSREKSLALTKLDECLLWLRVTPVAEAEVLKDGAK